MTTGVHPGGKELTSTRSAASFSTSSLMLWSGERGRAMRPVRVDSRMPKSEMSLRKESTRVGFAELDFVVSIELLRLGIHLEELLEGG